LVKVITVHSFKGGTGKSLIATNLAVLYATKGLPTCLVDMDFRAPTLYVAFTPSNVKRWFNDYLDGRCKAEEALIDLTEQLKLKMKFNVAFANPSPEAIREMMAKSTSWEREALGRLLDFIRKLGQLGYERCIIDTSPGYLYSSINALVAADVAVVVLTADDSDVEGTRRMLSELYRLLERKVAIVVNKVIGVTSEEDKAEISKKMKETLNEEVIGVIPCSCDVATQSRKLIYVLENLEHPFTKELESIVQRIELA